MERLEGYLRVDVKCGKIEDKVQGRRRKKQRA